MLKSTSAVALRAQALIVSWDSWHRGSLQDALGTLGGPRRVGHIRAVQSQAASYQQQAQALIADPNFASLDPDVQSDVTAIAEEMGLAVTDMDSESDPDIKFTASDQQAKLDATAGMLVNNAATERFKARASGQLRDQVPTPPKPPPMPPPVPPGKP